MLSKPDACARWQERQSTFLVVSAAYEVAVPLASDG
jgi:hypothetical protein